MCIKDRLQFVCEHRGMKLKQFHEETGLPYRTAQSYLNGSRTPNVEGLTAICTRLHVNLNWLVTGCGSPFLNDELTDDESELIDNYRNANEQGKQAVKAVAKVSTQHSTLVDSKAG